MRKCMRVFVVVAVCLASWAWGQVPDWVNYQGRLLDGTNLYSGPVNIRFRIYTNATDGAFIYEATNRTDAVDGLYATPIAEYTSVGTLSNALSQESAWLEVVVNGTTLEPRERIASVFYAQRARTLDAGAVTVDMLADGAVSETKLQDNAVTTDKIAAGAVEESKLATNAVTGDRIAAGSIQAGDIANNTFWQTDGNSGTDSDVQYLGTTDGMALALRVEGRRVLLLQPAPGTPNLIGGGVENAVADGVYGVVIAGGSNNTMAASTDLSVIGGGRNNSVGQFARDVVIGGGDGNSIQYSAGNSVIGGGWENAVGTNCILSTIGGGGHNHILEGTPYSTIGGGVANTVSTWNSSCTIAGGRFNSIGNYSDFSIIGGGDQNTLGSFSSYSLISGGNLNMIENFVRYSQIDGGVANVILHSVSNAVIGGGGYNVIGGGDDPFMSNVLYAVIGGGYSNRIEYGGDHAVVAGGSGNRIMLESSGASIGGGSWNVISNNCSDSLIGGGVANVMGPWSWRSVIGGGDANAISNSFASTIAGGSGNRIAGAADNGAIGGGYDNEIKDAADMAVIGGGWGNEVMINATNAIIAGGVANVAAANSFAAGRRAKATNEGSFVWADGSDADFGSSAENQFCVRAYGGIKMDTGTNIGINLNAQNGSLITRGYDPFTNGTHEGAGRWGVFMEPHKLVMGMPSALGKEVHIAKYNEDSSYTSLVWVTQSGDLFTLGSVNPPSDRNVKDDFQAVDSRQVLQQVASLPIQTWRYNADTEGNRHMGPVAQDFYAAFGVGVDDRHISTVDADGVALAAIQGLYQLVQELREENNELQQRLSVLEEQASSNP